MCCYHAAKASLSRKGRRVLFVPRVNGRILAPAQPICLWPALGLCGCKSQAPDKKAWKGLSAQPCLPGLPSRIGQRCLPLIIPRHQAAFPCRDVFPGSRQKEAAFLTKETGAPQPGLCRQLLSVSHPLTATLPHWITFPGF